MIFFWVFGTDVMETVAKSFDAPIKLLWPREEGKFSLLGLGDIVIPGFFLSMMLRFGIKKIIQNFIFMFVLLVILYHLY